MSRRPVISVQFLTHVDKYNAGEVASIELATALKLQSKAYCRILEPVTQDALKRAQELAGYQPPPAFSTAPMGVIGVTGVDTAPVAPAAPSAPATFPSEDVGDLDIPRRKK